MEVLDKNKRYTYEDYTGWELKEGERYELIDGVPYMMSAPTVGHQAVLGELFAQLHNFLKGKPCKPFISPIDVRLNFDKGDDTVVQPDIIVVCDKSKYEDGKTVKGAPDFIIEVKSPSTSKRDTFVKLNKYMRAGVREYWVVDPIDKTVLAHILKDGEYFTKAYDDENEAVPVHIFNSCTINLKDVFPQ